VFQIQEAQREAVRKQAEDLLKLGVVRLSPSKFNNPIYVVTKPDRGLRIVHNFLAINQKTLLEPYSMKNIQDSMKEPSRFKNIFQDWSDLRILANVLKPRML
jgi:hypothetical protein